MAENTSAEYGLRELRASLGNVVLDVIAERKIAYVMQRGKRVAAIVPLDLAQAAEHMLAKPGGEPSA
ncbi:MULTISPECIES: hypothetical protein [Streptomyces]|uniref:Antitoxin n=1 Tax=Streptomyces canarius TaxID=285453 RepID=A0ABQ3CFY5_9ACTN|nr:hypothetical protein [Streptomyces canarius]GHA08625.1 hypothetical protein GCM10010345_11220 [Streptomyces canarius]